MTALAIPSGLLLPPRKRFRLSDFEPWRILRPLKMDGQWGFGQDYQFSGRKKNPWYRLTMLEVVQRAGLTSGLITLLDASDSASYTSGQSWLDRSGSGHDFFVGETNAVTTSDPTFNGSAGAKDTSNYWSFDGNDNFRYDSTTPTDYENFHKSGGAFTFALWAYMPAGVVTNQWYFNTSALALTNTGFYWFQNSSGQQRITVTNGSGTAARSSTSTLVGTASTWQFRLVSLDSAGGASGSHHQLDATISTFNGSYTSPSASNSNGTCRIGRNAAGPAENLDNGWRFNSFFVWNRGLSQAESMGLFRASQAARFA